MKLFIKKTCLFLLAIALFLAAFEIYLRRLPTSYKIKENGFVLNSHKIEMLILGNSHAAYDINPNQFNLTAYNLAQVSQSLYFDKRLTLKKIDSLTNLKYVFISIDFHSLYFSSEENRDAWTYYGTGVNYKESLPFLLKNVQITGYSFKIGLNFLKKELSNRYKIINAVDVENGVDLNMPITKGWFAYKGTNEAAMNETDFKFRASVFNSLVKKSTEHKEIIADLENFIAQLQKRNITPILIALPCYAPYVALLDKNNIRKTSNESISISSKFHIPYWDYLNYPLEENNFYNCDHLNMDGANKFSKILNARLDSLNNSTKPLTPSI